MPGRRFAHVHVDLVGPLPMSGGHSHIFTMIDRSTRWVEAAPMSSTTAHACAQALFNHWIARFGVPDIITSDRGAQFTSSLWEAMCRLLNIQRAPTTAFHPQANGMVERVHRRIKDALRARCASADWATHLPWVMLALHSSPHEDTGSSPAEAVMGSQLVLPGQFLGGAEPPSAQFTADLARAMESFVPAPPRHNTPAADLPPTSIPADLLAAEMVFVRNDGHVKPLEPLYAGPYRVLKRSAHTFELQLGDRTDVVSVHRLKPAVLPAGTQPAAPPRRGRPLKSCLKPTPPPMDTAAPMPHSPPPPPPPAPHKKMDVVFKLVPTLLGATTRAGRRTRPPARFS